MSKKHKSYFDSSKLGHIEAMEATEEKTKKLHSAQDKVQNAYEMLKLVQLASHEEPEIVSLGVGLQIDKIVPLLESALKKLERHSIDHLELAFNHCLGGANGPTLDGRVFSDVDISPILKKFAR